MEKKSEDLPDVMIARVRAFGIQVCAKKGLDDAVILAEANRLEPCGTHNGWCSIQRGEDNIHAPVQCCDHEDREHLIIFC